MNAMDDEYEDNSGSDEDIDWDEAEETVVQGPLSYRDVTIRLNDASEQQQQETKKGKKRPRYTKEDKQQAIQLHKFELLMLLSRAQLVADWAFDEHVVACMLPITPAEVLDRPMDQRALHALLAWFRTSFRRLPDSMITEEEGRQGAPPPALLRSIGDMAASGAMLVQLFAAVCAALSVQTRYVVTLDPVLPRPTALKRQRSATSAGGIVDLTQEDGESQESQPSSSASIGSVPPYSWVEVFLSWPNGSGASGDAEMRWVAVDCLAGKVDKPAEFEAQRFRGRRMAYVVAVNAAGQVADVTQRYASRWSKTLECRLQPKYAVWWDQLVQSFAVYNALPVEQQPLSQAGPAPEGGDSQPLPDAESEAQELQRRSSQEPMPTSLEGFKKHPVYCMEQFLGQTEMLHPRKPVAVFKGRQVFERKHVKQIRTSWQWKKLLRQVLPEELSQPARRITRHGAELDLYGEWQTTVYTVPQVVDGVIPRNDYGNVEIWDSDPRLIPAGTVHLPYTGIAKVARELGVQYVEALTGFETKNGRRVPVIEGIVVLQDVAEVVLSAFQETEAFAQHKAEEKREAKIAKRWEKLVRAVLVREELRQRYGH